MVLMLTNYVELWILISFLTVEACSLVLYFQ